MRRLTEIDLFVCDYMTQANQFSHDQLTFDVCLVSVLCVYGFKLKTK